MKQQAVTIDDFLILEEQGRKVARLRAPAREVRRFHAAVRRFATAWCAKPTRRITAEDAKGTVGLALEVQDRYGWIEIMSLRAVHTRGEFLLRGPAPERKRQRLSAELRKAIETLARTWKLLPGAEPAGELCIVAHLPKLADSGFDRFLETAIEACETF